MRLSPFQIRQDCKISRGKRTDSRAQEGQTQTIILRNDCAEAVERIIRFMDLLDYDLKFGRCGQTTVVEEAENARHDPNHIDSNCKSADAVNELLLGEEPAENVAIKDSANGLQGDERYDQVKDGVINELKLRCRLYALAEKYVVKALMSLSRENFQNPLERVDVSTRLLEVVEEIYSSTPDKDRGLRDTVVSKVYLEIQY